MDSYAAQTLLLARVAWSCKALFSSTFYLVGAARIPLLLTSLVAEPQACIPVAVDRGSMIGRYQPCRPWRRFTLTKLKWLGSYFL